MRSLRNFVRCSQQGPGVGLLPCLRTRRLRHRRLDRERSRIPTFHLYWSDEPISLPCQGFDEARTGGRVPQHIPNLVHRRVQAVIEIDKGTFRPQALADLGTGDQLPGLLQQHDENVEGLPLQRHTPSLFTQLTRLWICLEGSESEES